MIPRTTYIMLNAYHILIDGLFDSAPILLSFMVLYFGAGEKAVGLIVSLALAAGTFMGLFTVFFSRRLGIFSSMSLAVVLYGAGFAGSAFAPHLAAGGLFFVIALAGHGVFHNLAFSYLTTHTERASLGKIMSDFTAIGDIGRIPLVSLAAFAAAFSFYGVAGWRVMCLVYGSAALCAGGWLLRCSLRRRREEPPTSQPKEGRRFLPSFALLRDRQLALAFTASVLNGLGSDQIFTFLPLLLVSKGIDPKSIATFALGFTVGCFAGKMLCGRLVDRFGPRVVFVAAGVMQTLLLLALVEGRQQAVIVGVALLLGAVTKGTVPVVQTIITEPAAVAGRYDDVFSINSFVRGVTGMLAPLLLGIVAAAAGTERIYMIMAVAACCAVLPVLAMGRSGR